MKVYVNMAVSRRAEAIDVCNGLVDRGIEVTSTWPYYPELEMGDGVASARVRAEIVDRELAASAAMLAVTHDLPDPGVYIRIGQAIELHDARLSVHLPIVWVGRRVEDCGRAGIRRVDTIADGIALLEVWASKVRGVPPEYARRSIWVYLQAQEAREGAAAELLTVPEPKA